MTFVPPPQYNSTGQPPRSSKPFKPPLGIDVLQHVGQNEPKHVLWSAQHCEPQYEFDV
jgi:hypothetical protein